MNGTQTNLIHLKRLSRDELVVCVLFLLNKNLKMHIKITALVSFLLSLYSCTTDLYKVDIDLSKGFEPQIAVTSILNPDSAINLSCMSTVVAYSNKPANVPVINKAILYDITNSNVYELSKNSKIQSVLLSLNNFKPKQGSVYKVVLETSNPIANIVITDTVPLLKPTITNVEITSIQNTTDFLGTVNFFPVVSESTVYYELVIFYQRQGLLIPNPAELFWQTTLKTSDRIVTQEDYYPSLLLLEAEQPQSLLFRMDKNNTIKTINFEYSAGSQGYWGHISSIDNNLRIELRVVSYNYFRYKTSLYKQRYAAEGDLLYGMSAPVKVYSNVSGGVGILGSYCKTDTTVFVEGKTYRN